MSRARIRISAVNRSAACRKRTFSSRVTMNGSMLVKGTVISLMVLVAATAFGGEDLPVIASLGKDPSHRTKKVLPPLVTEKYDYYEVGGCCEKDIQCDLKQKCIRWTDGKKYDAVTSWKVKWDYGYDPDPQACSTGSFRVRVAITFRLPKWTRPGDAPQQLVDKWDDYMKGLVAHENGHRDMAVEAAAELSYAVSELSPALMCNEMDRQVRNLWRARMAKLKKDEKEYDFATNHGQTQGAVFP